MAQGVSYLEGPAHEGLAHEGLAHKGLAHEAPAHEVSAHEGLAHERPNTFWAGLQQTRPTDLP